MSRLYSIISGRVRKDRYPREERLKLNQTFKKPFCWRCGGENVTPSKTGSDVQKFYYCKDCKEHYINF